MGRYDEVRTCYVTEAFEEDTDGFPERRTVHLGIDLFLPAGTAVHAPWDAIVHSLRDNDAACDYGPTVILTHRTEDGLTFPHPARTPLSRLARGARSGQRIARGEAFATLGASAENGAWPPHLHFQVVLDLLGCEGEFRASRRPPRAASGLGSALIPHRSWAFTRPRAHPALHPPRHSGRGVRLCSGRP